MARFVISLSGIPKKGPWDGEREADDPDPVAVDKACIWLHRENAEVWAKWNRTRGYPNAMVLDAVEEGRIK